MLKPKEQETEEGMAKAPDVQFDKLGDDLEGAKRAEGEEDVEHALAEVQVGIARPEALLEWIDDLRDTEKKAVPEDDNLERSFTMDFIPDTARDNAATESPPGDDYMFFSANRRDAGGDDDDGGGGGGGGGGGDGAGDEGDAPPEGADETKKPAGSPVKAKPAKPAKQAPKPDPPPPSKGGGKKPDGK